ncbi:BQ2448_5602 [Microbotryum intermedium]|uniref:BQ2448_5602 protein n=1 Tax=Microbotryum intermedium TaxID=269621 RepID=A0A238F780_9BASI|nr:BQ2448_5602 [Microbotryum intermedium]
MAVDSFHLLPTHGGILGSRDQAAYEPALSNDHEGDDTEGFQAQHEHEWIKIDYARLYSQLKLFRTVNAIRHLAVMFYLGIVGRVPSFSAKLATKTTPTDQRVVTMFGPKSSGGLDRFDLGVMIWHRKGVKPLRDENYLEAREEAGFSLWMFEDNGRVYGELGYALRANPNGSVNAWEPIFQSRVIKQASIFTAHSTVVPITIPGSFACVLSIHLSSSWVSCEKSELTRELTIRRSSDLAKNPWSELVATFTMLPTSTDRASVASTSNSVFKSSRPLDSYGSNHSWPLAWIDPSDSVASTPLDSFFAHMGAGYSFKRYEINFTDVETAKEPRFDLHLVTTTTLTAAKDYPTYELEDYEKVRQQLKESKEQCRHRGWWNPECTRRFQRDGHFENMIKLDSSKDTPVEAKDFTFDWRVGWSPLSPTKMAIAARLLPDWSTHSVDPFGYKARERDYLEVFHSFVGHNFNPRAHPITRTAVGFLAILLQYLSIPLLLQYWFVRSHAGGTSAAMFVLSYGNLAWMIIQSLYEWWDMVLIWFILKVMVHALLLLKQLTLIAHLQVRFENFVPAAVRFRPSTKLEQETKQIDVQIPWLHQVLFVATCFFCLHYGGSSIPRIVHSPMYQDVTDNVPVWYGRGKGITRAFLIGGSLHTATGTQIRLNYKLQRFGAEYRTTAFVSAAALGLSRISSLFIEWFGPATATPHFTLWDLISIAIVVVLAVQASMYPGISGKME